MNLTIKKEVWKMQTEKKKKKKKNNGILKKELFSCYIDCCH